MKGLVVCFQLLLGLVVFVFEQVKNNFYVDFWGCFDECFMVLIFDYVDYMVFVVVLFELYLQIKEKKYFEFGQMMVDFQWVEDYSYYLLFKYLVVEKFLFDCVVGWGSYEKVREYVV